MSEIRIIERQTDLLKAAMSNCLKAGETYALVDFPDYSNVGDSAIWIGARKTLEAIAGRPPAYICTHQGYDADALRKAVGNGPIFIIGGGNFGNLYPKHQRFRLRLMSDNPNSDIIQMPQSIAFKGTDGVAETADAMRAHGSFRLFVRDQASLDFAQRHFPCAAKLAPDCAFGMGFIGRKAKAEADFVFLRRSDAEVNGLDYSELAYLDAIELDWIEEPPMPRARLRRTAIREAFPSLKLSDYRAAIMNAKADLRLLRGLHILAKGEAVITDRLHGHILSVLSGIPDVAFDNSTGKVSGYHSQWMPDLTLHAVAASVQEAREKIVAVRAREIELERRPQAWG